MRARQQEAHQVEASVSRKEAEAHALEEKLTSLRAEVDRAKQAVAEKRDKAEQQLRWVLGGGWLMNGWRLWMGVCE